MSLSRRPGVTARELSFVLVGRPVRLRGFRYAPQVGRAAKFAGRSESHGVSSQALGKPLWLTWGERSQHNWPQELLWCSRHSGVDPDFVTHPGVTANERRTKGAIHVWRTKGAIHVLWFVMGGRSLCPMESATLRKSSTKLKVLTRGFALKQEAASSAV